MDCAKICLDFSKKMWPEASGWGRVVIEAVWLPDPWQKTAIQAEWQRLPFAPASLLFWFYLNWKGERAWEAANVNATATDKVKCALGRYTALLSQRRPPGFKVEAKHPGRADLGSTDCPASWPGRLGRDSAPLCCRRGGEGLRCPAWFSCPRHCSPHRSLLNYGWCSALFLREKWQPVTKQSI